MQLPLNFADETALDDFLAQPSPDLIECMKRLDGDLMILGIAGKMGVSLGRRAVNAVRAAGGKRKVIGVARFSNPDARAELEAHGVETIACDLLDRGAVAKLPVASNVIFMAGRKFGTGDAADLTWAMNTLAPGHVVEHFRNSRIVAFSTGCVYPLVAAETGGCTETVMPEPVGEYAQSCLGRERIFQYGVRAFGVRVLLFRLNYAIDLRYGVLHDIAQQIYHGEKVNNAVGRFNVIWQGDANEIALRSLERCAAPAEILNVTGPETASVTAIAEELGRLLGKKVEYLHPVSGEQCYLNNAGKMASLFGAPSVPLGVMLHWQAEWLRSGGASFGKPTHFEVHDGRF